MNRKSAFFILGISFLLCFYVFSGFVKKGKLQQFNFDMTVRLQDKIPKRLDSYWEDVTFFAEPTPSIVFVGLLTLAATYDIKKKKFRVSALLIPLFFGLIVFSEIYGKAKVESPAPPFFMLKNPTTIFPKFHVQEQYSYPSGHAARSLYFAIVMFFLSHRYTKNYKYLISISAVALVAVLIISVGKVYLGQHWTSDIIGGMLIALGFGSFLGAFLW